jgi:hypothetical protein
VLRGPRAGDRIPEVNTSTGTIRALLLAQERQTPMKQVPEAEAVEGRG